MLYNHLRIALRNILKRKGYTLFNILGLATGITCCLLIFQYVAFEKSYDSSPQKAADIVRLRLDFHDQGKLTMQSATVYPGLGVLLRKELPEIQNDCRIIDTRISWGKNEMIQNNIILDNEARNIKSMENHGFYADQSFADMFSVNFNQGDAATALTGPNKIAISESTAKKYFGSDNPVGKNLAVREGGATYHYEVSGVFKDYPSNSHLAFDYLVSYPTFVNLVRLLGAPKWLDPETSLSWYDYYDYLQLKPGTDPKKFDEKLKAFSDKYLNSEYTKAHNNRQDLYTMPLRDIHLSSHYNEEAGVNGDGKSVAFLFMIAFLIITIAWVNYTNLATSRSLERAREVGVRKVLGALRSDLVSQFLTESFLLNFAAVIIAIILAFCCTPAFNRLIGSAATTGFYMPPLYWAGFAALFLGGSFLSGLYPAFILSGYHPIAVLKGLFKNSTRGLLVRKGLIIGQFATSIILIAGTIVIYQQVEFMRNQKLGANINQTLVLNGPNASQDLAYQGSFQPFKNELLQISGIKSVTASSGVMGKEIYMTNGAYLLNGKDQNPVTVYTLYTDNDFLPSYDVRFVAGHNFSGDTIASKKEIVLSEEAIKLLGLDNPQKAIDRMVSNFRDSLKIVGVVANYHQLGLNKAMLPVVFICKPAVNNFYSLKFQSSDLHKTLSDVQHVWASHFAESPFSYFFLDESFNEQYKSGEQFGKVFGLFALIAIAIACFGLLGLSAYTILQRTKEIGVRKVLGASVQHIVFLLAKDFLQLVGIAFLVAVPVAWWVMNNWLHDFAYRISISWLVFVVAGMLSLAIAFFAISFQAVRAALANPVKSLRTE